MAFGARSTATDDAPSRGDPAEFSDAEMQYVRAECSEQDERWRAIRIAAILHGDLWPLWSPGVPQDERQHDQQTPSAPT